MKNLVALLIIAASFAFTIPQSDSITVNADIEQGQLKVTIDNQEQIDLNFKVIVFDAHDNKLDEMKVSLENNKAGTYFFDEPKEGFGEYPLRVLVKGKGRDKALFIRTINNVAVKK